MSAVPAASFLFVYGTLRRGYDHPMQTLLDTNATRHARGWYTGRLYRVSHYPGVVASEDPAERVVGDIYRLDAPDALLARLDDYEECAPHHPEPREYERVLQTVTTDAGERLTAWIYLFRHPVEGLERIVSGDFLGP